MTLICHNGPLRIDPQWTLICHNWTAYRRGFRTVGFLHRAVTVCRDPSSQRTASRHRDSDDTLGRLPSQPKRLRCTPVFADLTQPRDLTDSVNAPCGRFPVRVEVRIPNRRVPETTVDRPQNTGLVGVAQVSRVYVQRPTPGVGRVGSPRVETAPVAARPYPRLPRSYRCHTGFESGRDGDTGARGKGGVSDLCPHFPLSPSRSRHQHGIESQYSSVSSRPSRTGPQHCVRTSYPSRAWESPTVWSKGLPTRCCTTRPRLRHPQRHFRR